MFIRLMVALALMLPAVALAQSGDKSVRVEIVATGTVEVPATSYRVTLNWTSTGDNDAAARRTQEQNRAAIRAAVVKAGLPASALVILPARNSSIAFPISVTDASDSAGEPDRKSYSDRGVLRLTSLDQLETLEASLEKLDVTFGTPIAEAGDPASLRRQAKIKAIGAAREDALAYAATLGLRNVRIVRISEKSDGMLPLGMQDKFGEMMSGGPEAMRAMFDNDSPSTVRVVAGVLVEFVIEP